MTDRNCMTFDASDPGGENDAFGVTDPVVLKEFLDKEGNPPEGEWRPSKNNPYVMEWWGMGELMAERATQNASISHDVSLKNEP